MNKLADNKFKLKKITLEDIGILGNALRDYRGRICDISPGNLVFWRDYYDISYSLSDGGLVLCFGDMDGVESYFCHGGDGLLERLVDECGGSVRLTCVGEEELKNLQSRYECTDVRVSDDWNDYLYLAEDIVTLKGKRFCGQRNHINKFKKLYPNALFKEIEKEDVEAIKKFCYGYFHVFGNEDAEVASYEEERLYEQLGELDRYAQMTGMLTLDGEVLGFSIGEVVGDTLIVHTEKANTAYDGVYPTLVQAFATAHTKAGVRFINREEDCGVLGLRRSKLSYHPIELLKKYSVVVSKR